MLRPTVHNQGFHSPPRRRPAGGTGREPPMDLPPLPTALPPGWSIDGEHACSLYVHPDSALPYLGRYMELADDAAVETLLQYISARAAAVLASSTFLDAPVAVLQAVLSYPALAIGEDALLGRVMHYAAHKTGARSDAPARWSRDERDALRPVLAGLIPHLAVLSLSSHVFLRTVEPLELFSMQALSCKYKYDALLADAVGAGRSERDMVLEMFGGSSQLGSPPPGMPRARQSIFVSDSAHPHEAGGEEELQRVAVAAWAGRTCVEFDRRSCVAPDARLSFYGDGEGRTLLADWSNLWRGGGSTAGGRRFLVLPGHQFWVGFKCPARTTRPLWGWKFRARPIAEDE
jgi:hypothetical protein